MSTETDPFGIDPHAPGAKLDAGKPRPELIMHGFAHALMVVTEVATFGASKYTDNGWVEVPEAERRYMDALYRHLLKHHMGEVYDDDSGLPHLAHAAWNVLAVLELYLRQQNEPKSCEDISVNNKSMRP